jgi:zinc protease
MKKYLLITVLALMLIHVSAQELVHKTLPNGMELITKENHGNTSVGYYCFVKTGSETEGDYLGAGISHYLEHLVSSGTTTLRTEKEYTDMGKEMGAIVNAYTTSTVTCYHIIVDKEYKEDARTILSEQVQFCVLDSFEVAREREVILKEIVMRSTPPRAKVLQRNNELVYPYSNKRFPVIGYTELYKTITREDLQNYYKKRYSPNNMVFVAVGDFDANAEMDKLIDTFKAFPRMQLKPEYQPVQNRRSGNLEYIEEFDVKQPMGFLTTILPAEDYVDGPALSAALEILFAKRKSPIRKKLVEDLQLVNYVYGYADDSPASPEGIISIGFEAKDPARMREITQIIDDELRAWVKKGFTQDQLDRVINRMEAQELLSTPGVESECNSIGWSMITYGVPDNTDAELAVYRALTPQDLADAVRKHLLPKNRVSFFAMPRDTKAQLEKAEVAAIERTDLEKIQLKKNLTLLYRRNTEKPLVSGIINFPLTTNYETEQTVGLINFMLDIAFSGSKHYHPHDISEWVEDHAATYNVWADEYGTNIQFKCSKNDLEAFTAMLYDGIKNPSFDQQEIQLNQERRKASYNRSLSRGSNRHSDFARTQLYAGSRNGLSDDAKLAIITGATREDLITLHDELFRAESAIVTLFGDVDRREAEDLAEDIFAQFSHKALKATATPSTAPVTQGEYINSYPFEQVNLDIYYAAPSNASEDYWAFSVLQQILDGSRGRIFNAVRGTNDLAYYAFAEYANTPETGYLKLTSQTSIDKKDELIRVLKNEITKVMQDVVSTEELNSAIQERYKILKSYMNDNYLPYYATHFEAMGFGYDYLESSQDAYKQVTPEDVLRVARKYLGSCSVVVSEPDETVDLMVQ